MVFQTVDNGLEYVKQALFLTKFPKTHGEKTQDCKSSSQNLHKNSRYRSFSIFTTKRNSKNVVKNQKLALIWHFHFKFFITNLKTTLEIENLDIFREKTH